MTPSKSGQLPAVFRAALDELPDPVVSSADRIEYIADMLQELRGMAVKADHETLAGLLSRALSEARSLAR